MKYFSSFLMNFCRSEWLSIVFCSLKMQEMRRKTVLISGIVFPKDHP